MKLLVQFTLACLCLIITPFNSFGQSATGVNNPLAKGWNTWDTYSLLSYTHLPDAITINLGLKEYTNAAIMRNPLLYKAEQHITLGAHSDDGAYTELELEWEHRKFTFQSATDGDNLLVLVTPLANNSLTEAALIVEAGIAWQKPGVVSKSNGIISLVAEKMKTAIYCTKKGIEDPNVKLYGTYNVYSLKEETGISTGRAYAVQEIKTILKRNKQRLQNKKDKFGELAEVYDALQSSVAWNVVYDPLKKRVIVPVSRSWNDWHGGYVLFCWDNYFVSYMLSLYNKDLAYANAIAITNEATQAGFVPNMSDAIIKTKDRSQPPVGSFCVREIYRKYREKWFLELLYDKLLAWNRWWPAQRDINGLLAWGSNSYQPVKGNYWESAESGVGGRQGASFESGMDNAPMYFDIPFDAKKEVLQLWDVGLNSMYILDCQALADIAKELGKTNDYKELTQRGTNYSKNLHKLWNEALGIYCNRRTDNGSFSTRLSPTCFYPLLTDVPDQQKIDRMMKEHFNNPLEFQSEWMIPSVPKNDTSFKAQDYWQGRIWAPLNFLVYLGLRKHQLNVPKDELVTKSKTLLLKNWDANRYVCENYNALTGMGSEKGTASDPFYHWGALLGFMSFIENGMVPDPWKKLSDKK